MSFASITATNASVCHQASGRSIIIVWTLGKSTPLVKHHIHRKDHVQLPSRQFDLLVNRFSSVLAKPSAEFQDFKAELLGQLRINLVSIVVDPANWAFSGR